MSTKQAKIVFTPSGRRGRFAHGSRLLDAARSLGVDVDSVCGGRGICGRCQVICVEGSFPKHAITSRTDHLSPPGEVEHRYGERKGLLAPGRRLSCQALIEGDLLIDVPPESQMHRQVVRKAAEHRSITLDTSVHLYFIEVRAAALHDPSGDLKRLFDALASEWQMTGLECDPCVLPYLQSVLRQGNWQVTVAVHKGRRIIAVWAGFRQEVYGVALDIGSTTIAAHLCNLTTGEVVATDGIMNPQIRFGEDLMSRVSYVMMHPEGAGDMTRAVRSRSMTCWPRWRPRQVSSRGILSSWRLPAIRSCTTCFSASAPSNSAGRRLHWRSTARWTLPPAIWICSSIAAQSCTCCRVSPVTSARMPRP